MRGPEETTMEDADIKCINLHDFKMAPRQLSTLLRAGLFFFGIYLSLLARNGNYDALTMASLTKFRFIQHTFTSSLCTSCRLSCAKTTKRIVSYQKYILAPSSRILHPASVYKTNGTVTGAESLVDGPGSAIFHNQSTLTLDYGKNIAGVVSLLIGTTSSSIQAIGLTFSESSRWISGVGSDATAESGIDEILWIQPTSAGVYTLPRENERGAFRYLSLIHNSTGSLEVREVRTYFTAMPHYDDDRLRDYTGYFHSDGRSTSLYIIFRAIITFRRRTTESNMVCR